MFSSFLHHSSSLINALLTFFNFEFSSYLFEDVMGVSARISMLVSYDRKNKIVFLQIFLIVQYVSERLWYCLN